MKIIGRDHLVKIGRGVFFGLAAGVLCSMSHGFCDSTEMQTRSYLTQFLNSTSAFGHEHLRSE